MRGVLEACLCKLPTLDQAFNSLFEKKNLSKALENTLLVYLYREFVAQSPYFRTQRAITCLLSDE